MKKTKKTRAASATQIASIVGIIAMMAMIEFGFTACGVEEEEDDGFNSSLGSKNIGKKGPAGGIIFYYSEDGFFVINDILNDTYTKAYYLEAAPENQKCGYLLNAKWSATVADVIHAKGTEIGNGKENTAAIISIHNNDSVSDNAAKAAVAYKGGGKSDWFLPSTGELNEMYKIRKKLDMKGNYWSSTQDSVNKNLARYKNFDSGTTSSGEKSGSLSYGFVRAIRAF